MKPSKVKPMTDREALLLREQRVIELENQLKRDKEAHTASLLELNDEARKLRSEVNLARPKIADLEFTVAQLRRQLAAANKAIDDHIDAVIHQGKTANELCEIERLRKENRELTAVVSIEASHSCELASELERLTPGYGEKAIRFAVLNFEGIRVTIEKME
jgi:transposase-like protein